ncbi:hypothetical protein B0H66DRAFT_596840 [Apodospora peruviana]|uniref:Uncharacterized protein n=1 Tax=Apodospora peruviana TaxID=516989 RepID=A0AAE0IQ99_9PEZI|nr:hypothetical protein B0H66DRAFT_596840 [Apodospora peruviana]
MQLTTAFSVLATALSFAGSSSAWAQAADGTWVANNNWYYLPYKNYPRTSVHESCTYRNTNNVHNDGDMCAYWTNSNGGKFVGKCKFLDLKDAQVSGVGD